MDGFIASVAGSRKPLRVRISAMDADLSSINVESQCTGRQLFEKACRIIGLRETWFFGLRYTNRRGLSSWLQLDKRISQQEVRKELDGNYHFLFLVKFYPESVEDELIQESTRHLFFLQIKQAIVSMDLYCPPEASVLLASYALQADFGDCSSLSPSSSLDSVVNNGAGAETDALDLGRLLPQTVMEAYDMTSKMWEERVRKWWSGNQGLSREEAEMEYLRVAQDLDMFGIQYYPIENSKATELLLGISPQGIGIYELSNRLSPRPFFPWAEIRQIQFTNRVFTIAVADKTKLQFRAGDCSINSSILDLCVGAHDLYLRRRQPDTLEVQQMKAQAREHRERRAIEQQRLHREREARLMAEAERDRYKCEVQLLSDELVSLQSALSNGYNGEPHHKMSVDHLLYEESQSLAARPPNNGSSSGTDRSAESALPSRKHRNPQVLEQALPSLDSMSIPGMLPPDIQQEMEERARAQQESYERERNIREQLVEFRTEIANFKRCDKQTELDRIHADKVHQGMDKYSTLRKSGAGTSKSRVKVFDNY